MTLVNLLILVIDLVLLSQASRPGRRERVPAVGHHSRIALAGYRYYDSGGGRPSPVSNARGSSRDGLSTVCEEHNTSEFVGGRDLTQEFSDHRVHWWPPAPREIYAPDLRISVCHLLEFLQRAWNRDFPLEIVLMQVSASPKRAERSRLRRIGLHSLSDISKHALRDIRP